jgi:hypothetical protein
VYFCLNNAFPKLLVKHGRALNLLLCNGGVPVVRRDGRGYGKRHVVFAANDNGDIGFAKAHKKRFCEGRPFCADNGSHQTVYGDTPDFCRILANNDKTTRTPHVRELSETSRI